MSETKFTPGPWEWAGEHSWDRSLGSNRGAVIFQHADAGEVYLEVDPADAHLIAAAPELYETLTDFVIVIKGTRDGEVFRKLYPNLICMGEKVLAKARGETP